MASKAAYGDDCGAAAYAAGVNPFSDAGKAADVDEAKAAALRSAIAGSDVGLSPKEKQAAKQAAFAAKQAADSAKGFSISLPNPF